MRDWIVRGLLFVMVLVQLMPGFPAAAASHQESVVSFLDVPADHAESTFIHYLAERGLINGYPDGRFGPDDPLNRAAATKLATQVAGLAPLLEGAALGFSDLPLDHWAVAYVRVGLAHKVVEGFPDQTFRPDQPITRAELAALAVRSTRQSMDRLPVLTLADVAPDDWYHNAALLAVVSGMMVAEDGTFRPNDTATRAEAARAFARALLFSARSVDVELDVVVQPTSGLVEVGAPGDAAFVPITEPTELPVGGRVRTGALSTADISFPDGSALRLDQDSELVLIRSRGLDLITGAGVEDLEVELVRGSMYGGLVPRISAEELAAYERYLVASPESVRRDKLAADAVQRFMWASSGKTGENLPTKATRLMIFSDPASLEPGDKAGAEVTVVLVDDAGEPVTADRGPVTLQLLSDVGTFSNANPVIPEGYQAVTVTLYPPAKEPPDAKTRVTAVAGDLTASLTVPTAKEGWWDSLFSKKTRAKVRMPWSVASVRGTVFFVEVDSSRNHIAVLGGLAALTGANGEETDVGDNQSSGVDSPDSPPSDPQPMDDGEQQQWAAQMEWLRRRLQNMDDNAPDELRDSLENEHNRILYLAGLLPQDEVAPSIAITAPRSGAQLGTPTATVRGVASDDTKLASVTVNGASASVDSNGSWSATVALQPGPNTITATATDAAGNSSAASVSVVFNAAHPTISVSGPAATKETKVPVRGFVSAPGGVQSLTVNGTSVTPSADGAFAAAVDLEPGRNLVVAEVTDNQGLVATDELEIVSSALPPLLSVSAAEAVVTKPQVRISGQAVAQYADLRSVTVNGSAVLTGADGSFTALVTLKELGPNTITVTAMDEVGNTATEQVTVTFDAAAPSITLAGPKDGLITRQPSVTVSGTATAVEGVKGLTVNGRSVTPDQEGAFSLPVTLQSGANLMEVVLEGESGRTASLARTVHLVTTPPTLVVSQPADGLRAAKETITVSGSAAAAFGPLASVSVNGRSVLVHEGGAFAGTVKLRAGQNVINITATDAAGNVATESRTVTYSPAQPTLSISTPADGAVTKESRIAVSGTVQGAGALASVLINGGTAALSADGTFRTTVDLAPGRNTISVSVPEEAGGARTDLTVIYADRPPVLSVNAPADGLMSPKPDVVVSGSALTAYGTPARVSVGGMLTSVSGSGSFSHTVRLKPHQPTAITITATDDAGNQTSVTRTVTYKPALPLINISSPASGFKTTEQRLTVSGSVTAVAGLASVTVNGTAASFDASGRFSASVALQPGPQTITVVATDLAGGVSQASVSGVRGGVPPTISIGSPSEGFISGQPTVTVSGSASAVGGTIQSVSVNGSAAAVSPNGSWVAQVTLQPGRNTLTATVTDSFGTTASDTRNVTLTAGAPTISLTAPTDGILLKATSVVVRGQVQAQAPIQSLTVNNASVSVGADGSFQTTVSGLRAGRNTITASVVDQQNQTASASVTVMVVNQPPTISISAPANGATVQQPTVTVSGLAIPVEGVRLQGVTVNGSSASLGSGGSFSTTVTLPRTGPNTITVSATDEVGNTASVTRTVTFTPAPPSVSASAPATVSTASATISGSASSQYGDLTVSAGGQSFSLGTGGSFSATVPLSPGPNSFTVTARDKYGEASTSVSITYTPSLPPESPPAAAPPTVTIQTPQAGVVTGPSVTVAGTFTAPAGVASLKVNGVEATRIGSQFTALLTLLPGEQTITVELVDTENRKATASRTVTVAPPGATLTVADVTGQYSDQVMLRATYIDPDDSPSGVPITFQVNGGTVATQTTDSSGVVEVPYAITVGAGTYVITATGPGVSGGGLLTVQPKPASLSLVAEPTFGSGMVRLLVTLTQEQGHFAGDLSLVEEVEVTVTSLTDTELIRLTEPLSQGQATVDLWEVADQPFIVTVAIGANDYFTAPTLTLTRPLVIAHDLETAPGAITLAASVSPAIPNLTVSFYGDGVLLGTAETDEYGNAHLAYQWAPGPNDYYFVLGVASDGTAEYLNASHEGSVMIADNSSPYAWLTLTGNPDGVWPGDLVDLGVWLANPPEDLHGLSVELVYDAALLQLVDDGALDGTRSLLLAKLGAQYVLKQGPQPGTLILSIYSPDGPLPGRSHVATVHFVALKKFSPWDIFQIQEVTPGATSDGDGLLLLDEDNNVLEDLGTGWPPAP